MCDQLWIGNGDNITRPEDDEVCIRQESIRLYQRLLDFSSIRVLLLARLHQCVCESLKGEEINNNCLCALSILGGSESTVTMFFITCQTEFEVLDR